ncbi:TPA: hypothetical protein EYM82_22035 [Candidatus Poribacteria bacterium]|nr:hypothetical protein [Candidatus Poribacteria bacterium]HIO47286.1 hypothetical protein [Candidatus Poribacteria bacterium]
MRLLGVVKRLRLELFTMNNRVYIASIKSIFPKGYHPDIAVDVLYPADKAGEKLNLYAKRVAKALGLKKRYSVLDADFFPKKKLSKKEYHPLHWGKQILRQLSEKIDPKKIGFISVSYNISSHTDVLPNLACQLSLDTNLELDAMPEEISYYGCAGGLFSLKSAVEYCQRNQGAAYVYTFDQCSWLANPIFDERHQDFKANLITSLLFSDTGIGLLIIPENMKDEFDQPLLEIIDYKTHFQLGTAVSMREGYLVLDDNIKSTLPNIVSAKLIKPILKRQNLTIDQIREWSLHQGGLPILQSFTDKRNLNIGTDRIERSRQMFYEYGNLSAPSAFVVLESFLKEGGNKDSYGIIASFGAGYYLGAFLYRWQFKN